MADMGAMSQEDLAALLRDRSKPLGDRMRAVFFLKTSGGAVAVEALGNGLKEKRDGTLLRHELAYCLGQMRDSGALPVLEEVLRDAEDDPIVRHECGEAIGAIGNPESLPLLEEFSSDARREVSETCALAVARLKWTMEGKAEDDESDENPYHSVDPAPAESKVDDSPAAVADLQRQLMDTELPLFKRYRAMFTLRNMQSTPAVVALTQGLKDTTSALFRHEVAYVLGQLQHAAATEALSQSLKDVKEHEMVRHEAAEALGAIATPEALKLLASFAEDSNQIVKESCVIALDAADYWSTLEGGTATEAAAEEGATAEAAAETTATE